MDHRPHLFSQATDMGNAKFYFYPEPSGNKLVTIDLGEALGELFSEWQKDVSDGVAYDGSIFRTIGRTQEVINIQRDRMSGGFETARKFRALQNHLDRGFACSFSADSDNAFIFPVTSSPVISGDTIVQVGSNPFRNFVGTNVPAANDYMVMETGSPASICEQVKVSATDVTAANGGRLTFSEGLNFAYDRPAFVRWHWFWPVLRRPASDVGKSIITNEHGLLYSLDLRLIVDYSGLFAFHRTEPREVFPFISESDDDVSPYETRELFGLDTGIRVTEDQLGVYGAEELRYMDMYLRFF